MRQIDPFTDLATLFSMVTTASPVLRETVPGRGRSAATRTTRPWRRLLNAVRLWQQRAHGRQQLRAFDDHMLRDIGVTRLQAEAEATKPFWRA
jgi:uncharacterized protein YjiS (DUF1127 family)